ncbi:hypothetical protein AVEN_88382-1 [Araneus ventricosus]|uniref:Uncharacterized protein n=1 Tax=Araneus ventricosus TaxID=182803 RepID=A0A4Y2GIC4_ARAVE|nr:hypothetical protein AVEN_88382-1 [Araneus ventricosus]
MNRRSVTQRQELMLELFAATSNISADDPASIPNHRGESRSRTESWRTTQQRTSVHAAFLSSEVDPTGDPELNKRIDELQLQRNRGKSAAPVHASVLSRPREEGLLNTSNFRTRPEDRCQLLPASTAERKRGNSINTFSSQHFSNQYRYFRIKTFPDKSQDQPEEDFHGQTKLPQPLNKLEALAGCCYIIQYPNAPLSIWVDVFRFCCGGALTIQ